MQILILNWRDPKNPKSGGAELVTQEHARAWVKAGHSVVWFTSCFKNAKKEETIDGIKIVRQGNAMSVYLLAPFFYFFSEDKFDIVIDEIHGIPFFTPLYVKKARKIAFIHEVAGEIWDYMYPFPVNKIGKLLEYIYLRIYKNIQFWTDAPSTVQELVENGIPRQNCTAIPCPVNNSVLQKMPVKEKVSTYIFVSRVVKMKGIEQVLKAFARVLQQQPEAKLWIVGGGEAKYIEKLHKFSKSLGISENTIFWGRVSEKKKLQLMGRAHILLHASVKEGWGLVVLEAASQGTPAVVYKVPGLVDSVKDGQTGIIVKENTPESLGHAALELIENEKEYKKLQQGGLAWAKSITWDKVTHESLNLITTL